LYEVLIGDGISPLIVDRERPRAAVAETPCIEPPDALSQYGARTAVFGASNRSTVELERIGLA
jgi:hypothetical protein